MVQSKLGLIAVVGALAPSTNSMAPHPEYTVLLMAEEKAGFPRQNRQNFSLSHYFFPEAYT